MQQVLGVKIFKSSEDLLSRVDDGCKAQSLVVSLVVVVVQQVEVVGFGVPENPLQIRAQFFKSLGRSEPVSFKEIFITIGDLFLRC